MDKEPGSLGVVLGAIFAVAAVVFIISGGGLGGKKTIDGDDDLPPVAQGTMTR